MTTEPLGHLCSLVHLEKYSELSYRRTGTLFWGKIPGATALFDGGTFIKNASAIRFLKFNFFLWKSSRLEV